MKLKFGLLLFITFAFLGCKSQVTNEVSWKVEHKDLGNNTYEIIYNATIEDNWHLYSKDNTSDDPMALMPNVPYFEIEQKGIEILDLKENGDAHVEHDKIFDADLKFYEKKIQFIQTIKLTKPLGQVSAYLEVQICNMDLGQCKLQDVDYTFPVEFKGENTATSETQTPEENQDEGDFFGGANSTNAPAGQTILDPVKWDISYEEIEKNTFEISFKAKIDEGWHLYSAYIKEGGPKPTKLVFEDQDVEFVSEIAEEGKIHEEFDDIFGIEVKYYNGTADFKQTVKVNGDPVKVEGVIDYMVCSDQECVPLEEDFTIELREEETTAFTASDMSDRSLLGFFILAFLGGLVAIIMPCVFPMIPMTVSFFMHNSENKRKAKFQALVFSLSIIIIFFLLGVVLSMTKGPEFTNWLSTHWFPNIFFTVLFLVFAASFFGLFELTLPSWLINKSDKQADKGGFFAPFFMALTLVLVSFSCTVPIVGLILVEAATGEVIKPIIGMLGFSLAFALPFGFFAFFPSKLGSLPKSGGWLNTVKVVFGFIELALALKFLSVADQTYHWNLLPREVYIAFWIVIFTLLGFYFLGKLKFAHDSEMPHIPVPRFIMAIISFSFVVYLLPGMIGAPLKGLSGYLPPQETHNFDINAAIRDYTRNISTSSSNNDNKESICEAPKYADILHLPHGLHGYFDFEQALACAKAQNKPLFIDFTGHGCVNCREMEQSVWVKPQVLEKLKNDFVIVALYVDDKKIKLPENEWVPSQRNGKMIKTLSKLNSEIQVNQFGSNSQPNYILLDTDGKTVLAPPRGHNKDVQEFVEFLDTGLENFKKRHP